MMNCDEFQHQFHRCIDRRESSLSTEMLHHADQCESCRHQRELWQTIENLFAEQKNQTATPTNAACIDTAQATAASATSAFQSGLAVVLTVAACLTFIFVRAPTDDSVDTQSLTSIESVSAAPASRPELDPSGWWNQIRQRNWVSQTMPTVRVVRDGVAPLGRSIQRAATLLTTASKEQTS